MCTKKKNTPAVSAQSPIQPIRKEIKIDCANVRKIVSTKNCFEPILIQRKLHERKYTIGAPLIAKRLKSMKLLLLAIFFFVDLCVSSLFMAPFPPLSLALLFSWSLSGRFSLVNACAALVCITIFINRFGIASTAFVPLAAAILLLPLCKRYMFLTRFGLFLYSCLWYSVTIIGFFPLRSAQTPYFFLTLIMFFIASIGAMWLQTMHAPKHRSTSPFFTKGLS